jgi:hypothetical protein
VGGSLLGLRLPPWLVPIMVVAMLLVGCSPDPAPAPVGPSPSTAAAAPPRLTAVRDTLDALVTAVRSDDRAAFQPLISDRDPSFGDRARLLYDNLSALPLADLSIRAEPGERPLTDARRAVLGENAWAQSAIVTWRLTGETADAEHQIWLTFVATGNTVRLAGTLDGPATERQQPSWWLGPVTARRQGSATVIVGAGQPAGEWAAVAAESAAEVRRRLPVGLGSGWSGHVTFEIPATERDFESILGVKTGSHRGIAAVAHQEGSSGGSAYRVVVNPRVRELLDRDRLPTVLAHETVHVATRASESPAPTWAEEGLAEWVSLRARPGQRSWQTADLLTAVRSHGAPRSLPTDDDFEVDAKKLGVAYAESWLACRYIADRYSARRLGRLYAELDRGKSLEAASRSVLRLSEQDLVRGWRAYLQRLAERA